MPDVRTTAVAGLVPPQQGEARIREKWPAIVPRFPALANLSRLLMQTTVLAPVAWLLLAPLFVFKFLPFVMRRYTLTNRRVIIQAGWSGTPVQDVKLEDIDNIWLVTPDATDNFYRTGTLEILSDQKVVMTLPGTEDPETFRQAILNARNAWVPAKAKTLPFIPASAAK